MKLKDSYMKPAILSLPESLSEIWDLGDGYEVAVSISEKTAGFGVHYAKKSITYEVAKLLGLDVSREWLTKRDKGDAELFAYMGIDCVMLAYRKPENYKELLEKIEVIVNEHFKKNDKNLISENED